MNLFRKITSRPLWVNIAFALGIVIILVLLFMLSLDWITRHGASKTVPAVIGKNISQAETLLDEQGFDLVVQDSVFYDSLPPGMVIRQVPDPDAIVKINRTVYVTINRFVAPDVNMPNLIGSSYRNAVMVLTNMGLRVGDTTYRVDFAKNAVLEQLQNGRPIAAGSPLRMGSVIDLVLGSGVGEEEMNVPNLIGMSYDEARALLDAQGLSGLALFDPNVTDSLAAFVYRQSPPAKTPDGAQIRIRPGQMIDIWLSVEKPVRDTTPINMPTPQ